jgi:hypothetical protein
VRTTDRYNIYYNSNTFCPCNCTHVTGDWERESGQSAEPYYVLVAATTQDIHLWWLSVHPSHAVIASLKNSTATSKIWACGICCLVRLVFFAAPLLQLGPVLTWSLLLLQATLPKSVAYPGLLNSSKLSFPIVGLKEIDQLEGLDIGGRIILKWILDKYDGVV